jgi:hypothetical protein
MKRTILFAAGLCVAQLLGAETIPFRIHGQAWVDAGRIMQSSDSARTGPYLNLNGTWMQSSSAQLTVMGDLGEHWEGAFGFGATRVTHALGRQDGSLTPNYLAISMFKSYVTQARLTYFQGEKSAPWFALTFGTFAHNYNPDAKNLGLYLLRGPVYPGVLVGGYGDYSADTTRGNILGARAHHAAGNFSHDLLFMNERNLPPTFDWSLAYVAKYRLLDALEIGAGVNFHRLVAYNSDLTVPGRLDPNQYDVNPTMYEVSAGGDTTFYSHQGTKLMAMFSLDLKRWISPARSAPRDMRVYGEAAVIGVKDYGEAYGDITERIPVMVGFNFPTFGILDLLSLEMEWYGSPHANDLSNLGNPNSIVADWTVQDRSIPSPGPIATPDSTRDNFKWSVNLEKTVRKHIVFSAQVANDHFRPRSLATGLITATGGNASSFTTPRDWYFTFRLGYFF